MKNKPRKNGFSLTEVLMAISILAIAMVFVGGLFPVGMQLTKKSSEQTIAAIIADEAFAKIKLYARDPAGNPVITAANFAVDELYPFLAVINAIVPNMMERYQLDYPSTYTGQLKQYCWSALCRRVGITQVQVTVFVSKKLGPAAKYWNWDAMTSTFGYRINVNPEATRVQIIPTIGSDILTIFNPVEKEFINDGSSIVDNATGQIYRVLERDADFPSTLTLDRVWESLVVPLPPSSYVWVIPPAENSGQNLCIGVYQKVIEF